MKTKSLLKSLRASSRKSKPSTISENGESTWSTELAIAQATQGVTVPASTAEIETSSKDASQDQVVARSSIARSQKPKTPIPKNEYGLHRLDEPSHANTVPSENQYPIDFIAVHGLNGGYAATWTDEDTGYNWLKKSLPAAFPGARIFSFGYSAEVFFTREKSEIADFARDLLEWIKSIRKTPEEKRRPLIFLCHSMGGIVVKKAFNISVVDEERYGEIRKAVPAIVFFATPHRGSSHADFFANVARVANVPLTGTSRIYGTTRSGLIKSLGKQSKTLSEISMDFRHHTNGPPGPKFYSFYETCSTRPLEEKVVDDMSARLDVHAENSFPMTNCDHRNICRFKGKKDPKHILVLDKLQEIATEAITKFEAELTKEDEPCLHSLSFQTMTTRQQETLLTTPHPKSCTWILTHPFFLSWISSTSPTNLLWIKGHPGSGKSTLMGFLSHNFSIKQKPDTIIVSFFFHGNGSALQKSELGMFRSLLHQIYKQDFLARKTILAFFQRKVKESGVCGRDWEWQIADLKAMFTSIICPPNPGSSSAGKEKRIVIFVDALDEARMETASKAAKELVSYFHFLNEELRKSGNGSGVKICISSRHYPVVSGVSGLCVNVEEENTPDISAFVSQQLRLGVEAWDKEDEDERQMFEEVFVAKAAGIFLWAKIRIEKIIKGLNDGVFSLKDIREMVEEETNELSDLYKTVLMSDIEVDLRSKAFRLIQWVCLAERPLTLGELRFAMGYDKGDEEEVKPFVDNDTRMEKLVKSLSGGLAEVRYSTTEGIVQLFHQSVNDFLRADGLALLRQFTSLDDTEDIIGICEDRMSKACLRYLMCEEIIERANTWMGEIQTTYIFVQYATGNWAIHAERADILGIRQEHLVEVFATCPKLLETWISLYKAVVPRSLSNTREPFSGAGLIHIASINRLESTAMCLLEHGVSLFDENDTMCKRPLDLAARGGHDNLVQRYIDLGASVNGEIADWPTPLERAAAFNQLSTVKVLLKNGARLGTDVGTGSALHAAAGAGNVELIRVLIDAGVDVNLIDGDRGTALHYAAELGQEEAVKVLTKNGASVNASGGYFGSVLQAAIFGPKEHRRSITIHLLVKGADVNLQGGEYGNPLQRAAQNREAEIVELLLREGADVNAQGGKHGTALQAAATRYENTETIKLLLDHGADINAQAGEHGTAMQAAAANGNEEVVELLVKLGADVNASGGFYGNALQAAVSVPEGGTIVSLLLENGARIQGQSGHYGNVLQAAIHMGNENLTKHFLSLGMVINETGGHYGDNLQAAVPFGKVHFIKYLLDQGANVNVSGGGEYGSPLRAAIFLNRPTIVKLLLDSGADSNESIAGFPGTPLQQAARKGDTLNPTGKKRNLEIVRALLDAGADIESQNGCWKRTPLRLAIDCCHKEVVELLLARGARLDVSEQERRVLGRILEVE